MTLNPITIAARILLGRIAEKTEEAVVTGLLNAHGSIEDATADDGRVDIAALAARYPQLLAARLQPAPEPAAGSEQQALPAGQRPARGGSKR